MLDNSIGTRSHLCWVVSPLQNWAPAVRSSVPKTAVSSGAPGEDLSRAVETIRLGRRGNKVIAVDCEVAGRNTDSGCKERLGVLQGFPSGRS